MELGGNPNQESPAVASGSDRYRHGFIARLQICHDISDGGEATQMRSAECGMRSGKVNGHSNAERGMRNAEREGQRRRGQKLRSGKSNGHSNAEHGMRPIDTPRPGAYPLRVLRRLERARG